MTFSTDVDSLNMINCGLYLVYDHLPEKLMVQPEDVISNQNAKDMPLYEHCCF